MAKEEVKQPVAAAPTLDDVFDETAITEDSGPSYGRKDKKKGRRRKIVLNLKCPLCESGVKFISYKDVYQLKKFTSVRGKLISTEKTGVCDKHQRQVTTAVKQARYMALLPYVLPE
jgi:small subunit ribosomal protein S18